MADREVPRFAAIKRCCAQEPPRLPHSDSIVYFVMFREAKIAHGHAFMPMACKHARNRVYSRLLGDRNDSDEGASLMCCFREGDDPRKRFLGTVFRIRTAAHSTRVDPFRHFAVGMSNLVCCPRNPLSPESPGIPQAVESRLERNPLLPKWDISIRPA